jgi:hypothetical protein
MYLKKGRLENKDYTIAYNSNQKEFIDFYLFRYGNNYNGTKKEILGNKYK